MHLGVVVTVLAVAATGFSGVAALRSCPHPPPAVLR